jgi:UrcA family protein
MVPPKQDLKDTTAMLKTSIIAAAATVSLATSAAPALAGPPTSGAWRVGNSSYHLYLSDLDLQTAPGRAEALRRVERVAAKLCSNQGVQSRRRACVAAVVHSAKGSAAPAIQVAQDEGAPAVKLASRN